MGEPCQRISPARPIVESGSGRYVWPPALAERGGHSARSHFWCGWVAACGFWYASTWSDISAQLCSRPVAGTGWTVVGCGRADAGPIGCRVCTGKPHDHDAGVSRTADPDAGGTTHRIFFGVPRISRPACTMWRCFAAYRGSDTWAVERNLLRTFVAGALFGLPAGRRG